MADDVVGWVSGPTERGTLTLVWSCAVTIFACTWTVLHLNVPGHKDTSLTVAVQKFKWMVINILFPEFVFSKAVCDLRLALQELRDLDECLQYSRETIKWITSCTGQFGNTDIIVWTWEIAYPDGWSGLLYDLLRLDRPPHLLKLPTKNMFRKDIRFRRFLTRCIVKPHSVPTHPENSALESMEGLATKDHRQTGEAQRQSDSIREVSYPEKLKQDSPRYHLRNSTGDQRGNSHVRVDGSILEPDGTTYDGSTTKSLYTPSQEQDIVSTTTQDGVLTSTRMISQQWTVVHSYYAQMGGLVFPDIVHGARIITASYLTERYRWHENVGHPLLHLVLGKDDIQDKSKADWLLKSLAVIQVAWIITNAIARHTTGLPISQLEIATVAFAIMAVLIYLANWWKPKDISQPTTLHSYGSPAPFRTLRDRKQSFTQRILSPTKAIDISESVPNPSERVANDVLWLEGKIPLLFYLMAGSSFIFGALHCLAWNFEFPTRVESICWRVASLASAVLPIVALAISSTLGHLVASRFSQRHIKPKLSAQFNLILPDGPRRSLLWPDFTPFGVQALYGFARTPKQSRNWEKLIHNSGRIAVNWTGHHHLRQLTLTVSGIYPSGNHTERNTWEDKAERAKSGKNLLQKPEVLELWRDYEEFVKSKYPEWKPAVAAGGGAETTYLYRILDVVEKVSTEVATFKKWAERASNLLSITCFILYTAARLIILVLSFTSLRAAPAGLYQNNVWSRFLPKIS